MSRMEEIIRLDVVVVDLSDVARMVGFVEDEAEPRDEVVVAREGEKARPVEANNPTVKKGNFMVDQCSWLKSMRAN
jgi:hypothetical protein